MIKKKKPMITGIIVFSIVLLVAGILLWCFLGEQPKKQSAQSHKVPSTQEGQFPYQIPNTSLVIQDVRSYDGVFIEDGSDREVVGISAIIVENVGDECIEYAKITTQCNEKNLVYELRTLEPKAVMMVQESTAAIYEEGEYQAFYAEIATMDSLEMSEHIVTVEEGDSTGIRVTNISAEDIPTVRIFYKFYESETNVLLGGITYTAKITDLKKGETREVVPSHYEKGASRIMMVRTYDTY